MKNIDILYPQLSYDIMGIFFDLHTSLGNELQEKVYQKALEHRLVRERIPFKREYHLPIEDGPKIIGKYFIDFVVDSKIAIELKATSSLTDTHIRQLLAYLQVARLKLGILVNFRTRRLTYKRIVNAHVQIL